VQKKKGTALHEGKIERKRSHVRKQTEKKRKGSLQDSPSRRRVQWAIRTEKRVSREKKGNLDKREKGANKKRGAMEHQKKGVHEEVLAHSGKEKKNQRWRLFPIKGKTEGKASTSTGK